MPLPTRGQRCSMALSFGNFLKPTVAKSPTDFQYAPTPTTRAKSPTDFQYSARTTAPTTAKSSVPSRANDFHPGTSIKTPLSFGLENVVPTSFDSIASMVSSIPFSLGSAAPAGGNSFFPKYSLGTPVPTGTTGGYANSPVQSFPQIDTVTLDGGSKALDLFKGLGSNILGSLGGGSETTETTVTPVSFGSYEPETKVDPVIIVAVLAVAAGVAYMGFSK